MSIADKLTRLSTARDNTITALAGKGVTATGHGFEDFPADIAGINNTGWRLIATADFTVTTTSTSNTRTGYVTCDSSVFTDAAIIYVKVRDKAGPRNGYFAGSDAFFFNYQAANGATDTLTYAARLAHRLSSSGEFSTYTTGTTSGYGVYGSAVYSDGRVAIYQRYNSTYSLTINGTYNVEIYALDYAPNTGNPFDYTYAGS